MYLTEIIKAFGLVLIFVGILLHIESLNVPLPKFIRDIIKALKAHTDEESRKKK